MLNIGLVCLNACDCVNQGAGYIASTALCAGHNLTFYDTFYEPVKYLPSKLATHNVVLLSCSTLIYPDAKWLATRLKQRRRKVTIVLGGIHATVMPHKVLEDCKAIDYVCVGEGEEFILELLRALEVDGQVSHIKNLGYRNRLGNAIVNPPRPATDLHTLPTLRYDLFQRASVVQSHPWPGFCYVYATRGCPYSCYYCNNKSLLDLYGRSYLRSRPVGQVIEEMLTLKRLYQVKFFYFGDEMILFNQEYVAELFNRVKEKVQLPFGCMVRVEHVTPVTMLLLKQTGCRYVAMGVECGNEQFRREYLGRYMTNQQIIDAFQLLKTIPDIKLSSFVMTKFPVPYTESLDEDTQRLVDKLEPDIKQKNTFHPFPGTKMYDYCVKHKLIDWTKYHSVRRLNETSVLKEPLYANS